MEVNSKGYWDKRFDTDWISNLGRFQSAFFSNIGLGGFPEWLSLEIENKQLSICDWGCALGDGTNVLKNRFPQSAVTGIDFSSVAIADAKETYPQIQFLSENLLEKDHTDQYDIVFSSNTLEHFSNPWDTLLRVSECARRHLVALVPFKERNRYSEHLYTFTEANIPAKIGPSFLLTHVEIIDGGSFTPSYWGELQVLLVYSHSKVATETRLKVISDSEIRIIEGLRQQKEVLKEIQELKAGLKAELANKLEQELSEAKGELTKTILELTEENGQLKAELAKVHHTLNARNGIRILLEEQIMEKEQALAGLQSDLDREAEAARHLNKANEEFQVLIQKLQSDLEWYRATYEKRSMLGVLKDKTIKSRTQK